MVVPGWILLFPGRRARRERLAARKVARERAAVQWAVEHRAQESHDELELRGAPSQGDLMCFNAAIHPC